MQTLNERDVCIVDVALYFLPVETRVPLKFGGETLTAVTCARVAMTVQRRDGVTAVGWGETPLNVQWAWPGDLRYSVRQDAFLDFTRSLASAYGHHAMSGHALEIGQDFIEERLPALLDGFNASREWPMPQLAALICASAFDIALHDAYGVAQDRPIYELYGAPYMNHDLAAYLEPASGGTARFEGRYPQDYFGVAPSSLPAWHLVGGMDPIDDSERSSSDPDDGYPVTLEEWIARDGLSCLKVKLRGNDAEWDYARLAKVGAIAIDRGIKWLTADFNCTVQEPDYVHGILDRIMAEHPRVYGMLLYVEQPFPYDMESQLIDVHSLSARKPLFMDESAHDWRLVRLGRSLGWNGVALKTCKTQTGALLSLCWAKAHGMGIMVQDLTNPMLAQIPHVLLAAHAGTIMGVETNAMQFYPEASKLEARIHPGLYARRNGAIDLVSIEGAGFGYRVDEIGRSLPPPESLP